MSDIKAVRGKIAALRDRLDARKPGLPGPSNQAVAEPPARLIRSDAANGNPPPGTAAGPRSSRAGLITFSIGLGISCTSFAG